MKCTWLTFNIILSNGIITITYKEYKMTYKEYKTTYKEYK